MIADLPKHFATHKQSAFTLIEIMFVITLISVLMCWSVPSIKRAYKDFKTKETFEQINTLIASIKAFYLIDNEFPSHCQNNKIMAKDAWCFPHIYYDKTSNKSEYVLAIHPYGAPAYNLDNWLDNTKHRQFYVAIFKNPSAYEWHMRLRDKYPTYKNHLEDNHAACLGFWPKLENYIESGYGNHFY